MVPLLLLAQTAVAAPVVPANCAIGVQTQRLNKRMRRYLEAPKGLLVTEVLDDGPADRAGVEVGDVIVEVDQAPVWAPAQLPAEVWLHRGKGVELVVVREEGIYGRTVFVPASTWGHRPRSGGLSRAQARRASEREARDAELAALHARVAELEAQR